MRVGFKVVGLLLVVVLLLLLLDAESLIFLHMVSWIQQRLEQFDRFDGSADSHHCLECLQCKVGKVFLEEKKKKKH